MSVFNNVLGNSVGRSVFDLSYVDRFSCDMGMLIPTTFIECVPGDTLKIGMECVTRFQPLVAPILDGVNLTVHYFFVPSRLLMDNKDDWENFITGGVDGKDESVSLPLWQFHNSRGLENDANSNPFSNGVRIGKYSLWDYFGLPVIADKNLYKVGVNSNHINGFAQRAYNLIWNEFYRDENLCDKVALTNNTVLYRAWKKDYFTSALPWQQRGVAPALPLSGTVPLSLSGNYAIFNPNVYAGDGSSPLTATANTGVLSAALLGITRNEPVSKITGDGISASGTVNLSNAATFDIATLRQCMQVQRWMELNARCGVRYTEFLKAHFGLSPRDEVLQRPEYIGGTKSPIVFSEVLQTSATSDTSPQGNLAGHALGASQDYICTYTCKEFGYIVGVSSWMPKTSYQQGIHRMFTRKTKFDFYFPEFAHLSEQAITKGEVYATFSDDDKEVFGYQSAYNEMRSLPSINCSDMRDTFSYWHLGRIFKTRPSLNAGFITTNPSYDGGIRKDIFAVQNEMGLVVQFGNLIKGIRPLPAYGTPGFVDHVGRM